MAEGGPASREDLLVAAVLDESSEMKGPSPPRQLTSFLGFADSALSQTQPHSALRDGEGGHHYPHLLAGKLRLPRGSTT